MRYPVRLARCQVCGHEGGVPRDLPTTARLKCSACGSTSLVRECIGERPVRRRVPSPEAAMRRRAAREVLERHAASAALDDRVDDLWPAAAAAATERGDP